MKLRYLLAFLFVGCASKTTKMTPTETEVFMSRHSNFLQTMQQQQDPSRRYKHRYLDCTGSAGQEKCHQIDCMGLHEGLNCWKTELTDEEVAVIKKQNRNQSGKDRSELKKICESGTEKHSVRRQSCFEYFSVLDDSDSAESLTSTMKVFCDLQGVSCNKNGVPFGTGQIGRASSQGDLHGNELRIHRKNPDWVDIYQFSTYY